MRADDRPTARRVLVTGAASGLGLALTRLLVERGDEVLATDTDTERPASLPTGARYHPLDVRDDDAWAAALAEADDHWGGLDVLVNNAGVAAGGRIDVETMQEWTRLVDVNLFGVVRGCRAVTPAFKAQGSGHLVNVASLAGLVHAPGMSAYNAVKAGVVALSETLAFELAPHGIDVTVACPSFFRTGLGSSFAGADTVLADTGRRLVDGSRRGADEVAASVLRGVDARRHLVLTDRDGRIAWRAKRLAHPVYAAAMRRAGRRLAR
jgi:NAD(P)-dependent dehydrogenase (short-subunit alcohol dehydrogenase family)